MYRRSRATLAVLVSLPAAGRLVAQNVDRAKATPTADSAKASIAQSADTGKAGAPPAAPESAPLKISGYVTASYTYATNPVGSTIVGRLYDRNHDQFMLNAAKLVVEKPIATEKVSAGFFASFLFGQNAPPLQSAGLNLGTNGDVTQAYVTLNLPTGPSTHVQFKAGKIATLMGLEVIEDPLNPNLSEGNQFIYVENFTNTGVGLDAKLSAVFDAQLRIINGWDLVTDNNSRKSFMLRLGITPDTLSSIGLLGFYGPEQAGNTDDNRYGAEALLSRKFGKATVWAQGDYGEEQFATGTAKWYAGGLWLQYDAGANLCVALRGDYVDDRNGARTSGVLGYPTLAGQKFGSGTVTLNIKRWANLLVRPEVRYDRSNAAPFDGKKDQVTFALGATYIY